MAGKMSALHQYFSHFIFWTHTHTSCECVSLHGFINYFALTTHNCKVMKLLPCVQIQKPSHWHAVSESLFFVFSYIKVEPFLEQEVLRSHVIGLFKLVILQHSGGSLLSKTSSSLITSRSEWSKGRKRLEKIWSNCFKKHRFQIFY